jgi:hypothetical protein
MIAQLVQSLSYFSIATTWLVWLLTGKQPEWFVTATFTTLGAVTILIGIEALQKLRGAL